MKTTADIYVADDLSYLSIVNAETLGLGLKGNFILHAEGNPRKLYKLYKENKEEIGTELYFCLKKLQYFRNHIEKTHLDGVYKYKEI